MAQRQQVRLQAAQLSPGQQQQQQVRLQVVLVCAGPTPMCGLRCQIWKSCQLKQRMSLQAVAPASVSVRCEGWNVLCKG